MVPGLVFKKITGSQPMLWQNMTELKFKTYNKKV